MSDHVKSALEIGIHNRVEILFLHAKNQSVSRNPRIIHQNLKAFKVLSDPAYQFFGSSEVRHITLISSGLYAVVFLAEVTNRLSLVGISCIDGRDIGPFRGQSFGNGLSQSSGSSCHKSRLLLDHAFSSSISR